MLESVLQNLINIGWAMLIFLAAYLANVAFSLWYNIKILHESFDKDKLIASGLKILTFVVGLAGLRYNVCLRYLERSRQVSL